MSVEKNYIFAKQRLSINKTKGNKMSIVPSQVAQVEGITKAPELQIVGQMSSFLGMGGIVIRGFVTMLSKQPQCEV